MGLFIGASILTILEILDYIYEVQCLSLCLQSVVQCMIVQGHSQSPM